MASNSQDTKNVRIVCPVCKSAKKLEISKSLISKSKNLTIISIPKDEICEHHFQAFIDKAFKVRGYQKVDFEIEHKVKLPKGEFALKIILTGNYSVGKTSIVKQFIEKQFKESYLATLGVQISGKDLELSEETKVMFSVWDIAGQIQTMATSRTRFYTGANAAFIVVDRTREGNLKTVKTWYDDIKETVKDKIPVIIIGNKSDLTEQIVITEKDIKSVAEEFNCRYILTSAKTGENIESCFEYIAYECLTSK